MKPYRNSTIAFIVSAIFLLIVLNLGYGWVADKFSPPPRRVAVVKQKQKQTCRDTLSFESADGRSKVVGEWGWNYNRTLDNGVAIYVKRDCK